MERVCFTMIVADLERYTEMHAAVWPELLEALDRNGWMNYSLFLRDDGFLIGYLETPDWAAAQAGMDREPVSPRWSVEMDRLVVPGTVMRWPSLVVASPVEHAAYRVGFVLDEPPGMPLRNLAVFRRDDGVLVGYGESDAPTASPFREVFNLAAQLGHA